MAVLIGCGCTPDSPGLTVTPNPPAYGHPLKRGTTAHEALVGIDSLMWQQADSALKVMLEFAGSDEADSMDAFEGHYCQVMVAELLFKNYYAQSNRAEVLKAVHYMIRLWGWMERTHAVCPYKGMRFWRRGRIILMVWDCMNGIAWWQLAGSI